MEHSATCRLDQLRRRPVEIGRRRREAEEFVPSLAPRRKPDTNRAATPRLRAASIDSKA